MKKLLALVLAALLLFSMPVASARADGEDPAAEPPAPETIESEVTPEPTDPPAPAETEPTPSPSDPPAPDSTEEPAPTPEPTEEPEPEPTEEPVPTEEPEPTDEPVPTQEPEPEPTDEPVAEPEDDDEDPVDKPHDQPRWSKSLAYWERERQDIALTGDIREDVLIIARSQLGYSADATCYEEDETGRRFYTRYGAWDGATFSDWCDTFVSFCIFYAGKTDYPAESSCRRHMFALKEAGYWREWNAYVPQKGDIVFFSFPAQYPMPCHVGIVEEVIPGEGGAPSRLITIEGNQLNPDGKTACVRRMVRSVSDVVGYGTYTIGKIYPQGYSYRTDGFQTIEPDSPYFVEYPMEEVLRFLGLENTSYYARWFPEGPAAEPEGEPPAKKPLLLPKPQRPEKGKPVFDRHEAN